MKLYFLLLLVFQSSIINCSFNNKDPKLKYPIHLVIDAGSSGTRFCMYGIIFSKTENHSNFCKSLDILKNQNSCFEIKAPNGIADLDEKEAKQVIQKGIETIPNEIRGRIKKSVLLGTGGFRKKSVEEQQKKLSSVSKTLLQYGIDSTAKVISGEEEGILSWLSVNDVLGDSGHAIIETGGATIQVAYGKSPNVRSISLPVGLNDSFKKLSLTPEMQFCYGEINSNKKSFQKCKELILAKVFASNKLHNFMGKLSPVEKKLSLYGMGTPWISVFTIAKKNEITEVELETMGNKICSQKATDLKSFGINKKYAKKACFLFAYQSAFLTVTKTNKIINGNESWSRGASVAKEYFSECR